MRAAGLQGAFKRRRKGCTVRVAGVEPFGYLVGLEFRPDAADRVWVADLKQIRTGEGWPYLAAVQDLFSRLIVGWAMEAHMRTELVVAVVEMAVSRRRPATARSITPTHGGQYIGLSFGQDCHDAGIAQSMGAVGSCFDNAVAETFFATLTKKRLLHDAPEAGWVTRAKPRSAIFEYIEGFCNPTRLHSTLGMRSPVEYEADLAAAIPTASRARTRARNYAQPSVMHSYDNNNLTPRNRGRSKFPVRTALPTGAQRDRS
jgi:putative transposase